MTISKKPQLHTLNPNRSTMRFPIHLFVLLAAACWTLPSQAQTLADILADDCDAFVGGTYTNHNAFGADPNVPPTIEATAADSSWSLTGALRGRDSPTLCLQPERSPPQLNLPASSQMGLIAST